MVAACTRNAGLQKAAMSFRSIVFERAQLQLRRSGLDQNRGFGP